MSIRILVCGGRRYRDRERVFQVLDSYARVFTIEVVIHGDASGADKLADEWAKARGIEVQPFPANWTKFGRAAGPIRNGSMLRWGNPTHVIAFPGHDGTADMVGKARRAGVPVVEVE